MDDRTGARSSAGLDMRHGEDSARECAFSLEPIARAGVRVPVAGAAWTLDQTEQLARAVYALGVAVRAPTSKPGTDPAEIKAVLGGAWATVPDAVIALEVDRLGLGWSAGDLPMAAPETPSLLLSHSFGAHLSALEVLGVIKPKLEPQGESSSSGVPYSQLALSPALGASHRPEERPRAPPDIIVIDPDECEEEDSGPPAPEESVAQVEEIATSALPPVECQPRSPAMNCLSGTLGGLSSMSSRPLLGPTLPSGWPHSDACGERAPNPFQPSANVADDAWDSTYTKEALEPTLARCCSLWVFGGYVILRVPDRCLFTAAASARTSRDLKVRLLFAIEAPEGIVPTESELRALAPSRTLDVRSPVPVISGRSIMNLKLSDGRGFVFKRADLPQVPK